MVVEICHLHMVMVRHRLQHRTKLISSYLGTIACKEAPSPAAISCCFSTVVGGRGGPSLCSCAYLHSVKDVGFCCLGDLHNSHEQDSLSRPQQVTNCMKPQREWAGERVQMI